MTLGRSVLAIAVAAGAPSGGCTAAPPGNAGPSAAPQQAGGAPAEPRRDARRAEVRFPKGRVLKAEIADTPERWARGYMFRREVGENDAMVFVFPEPGFHPFWMKNTLVPLDIIWMDDKGAIVHIEAGTPPCKADPCPSYGPLRMVSSVLEVRAGTAAAEALRTGDRLAITVPQSGD
ncbi:MAG TPA: DUF192 domain-containing protein [Candidatus Polarisedimenticolia bacterium]|jgi:hypothetical protein|nr:DUF192 domain-containing protein [Candidatus Polarisedimenticolia bacterium]